MSPITLSLESFGENEIIQYKLKLTGVRGELNIEIQKKQNTLLIEANGTASLVFPFKTLFDHSANTKLTFSTDGSELLSSHFQEHNHKNNKIKTIVTENGLAIDPLGAIFIFRSKSFHDGKMQVSIAGNKNAVPLLLVKGEQRQKERVALGGLRTESRIQFENIEGGPRIPEFFKQGLEVWVDDELGLVNEVRYAILPGFGAGTLEIVSLK